MKDFFAPGPKMQGWVIVLARVVLGAIFIAHGWQKLNNMDAIVGFFGTLGMPAFMAYVVALVEFLGGIAVLIGAWTLWAGRLLALVMVGAIVLVKFKMGFMGGYELELGLLALALCVSAFGPGPMAFSRRAAS
ncbi:MAG: DoxX family protein [Patescibacteria group bacterium]